MMATTQNQTQYAMHAAQQPRILIVDDEYGPRESLRLILTPAYEVIVAGDGEEALAQFESEAPDMIISDIRMPRLNGIELMKEIKRRAPDTPFVLLTGFGTLESAQEAVRTGAFDYISKPYDVTEIRDVVAKAFQESRKRQNMEEALQRLQSTNEQLEQNIRELDQKAAVGDLSAEVIHDLNNPFCALQYYIDVLGTALADYSGFAESEEKDLLQVIKEQADRCIELTQRFLEYSRASGPRWSKSDVNAIIENTLFIFKPRLLSYGIKLETDLAQGIPPCWFQAPSVQQVFYNLITNAIHAMEGLDEDTRLKITTRLAESMDPETSGKCIQIAFADTGKGIPPEVQDRLFERFFTTKPKGKGTGLGLPICKRVTEEHGGSLTVTSEVGKGSVFTVCIPARLSPPDGVETEE